MSEKRKDHKGRILKTGEYWDPNGRRYMCRKMVDGERVTITDDDLIVEFGNNKNCRISMQKKAIAQVEKPASVKED